MTEIWKDIKGYEGKYQVSNLGNVRSLNYNHTSELKLLKFGYARGYSRVTLWDNGLCRDYSVHRLVAQTFIPNPNNYPYVNHKNEIKDDNRVENLEWCTERYNILYGTCTQKIKINQPNRIEVRIDDILFPSMSAAAKYLGVQPASLSVTFNCGRTTYKGHKIELIKKES